MLARHFFSIVGVIAIAAAGAAGGYWWARHPALLSLGNANTASAHDKSDNGMLGADKAADERKPLYWYDPMYPQQHFDKSGKSPFMDMQLLPKYADDSEDPSTVRIDPSLAQNIGMRTAMVSSGTMSNQLDAVGNVTFNGRDMTVMQARAGGYVERIYAHAPGDVVDVGSPLVDLLVPEWVSAQTEFLALLRSGDAGLVNAARERLHLRGMPTSLIARVESTRTPSSVYTVTTPTRGVIETQDIRAGMTVAAGQTLATIKGISSMWLEISVPEAQGGWIKSGDKVEAQFTAFPGSTAAGEVIAVLTTANGDNRTLTLRAQFDNQDGRLRPGMFANVRILGNSTEQGLMIPTESIIRTGKRSIVMVAEDAGRYRPVEIVIGREANGQTQVLSGLDVGQRVVVSGQFLIDSEASLSGVMARMSGTEDRARSESRIESRVESKEAPHD